MTQPDVADLAPVLSVRGVNKTYLGRGSSFGRFARELFGLPLTAGSGGFPALRDVSFEVFPGEAMAVLGRNGAGKSTLLQVVSGVSSPSAGEVFAPKRILGLLDLGSGFDPNFTGRENISLNAALLGLSRDEVQAKLGGIIAFAEIGDYIDQPVRTYSNGMFLRLAFSIATAAEPDLMLTDEVLAVGDVFFRQKCYERLRQMRQRGTAMLLVTHSLGDAAEFCDRAIVLSEGRLVFTGRGTEAVEFFLHREKGARTGVCDDAPPSEAADRSGSLSWEADPAAIDLSRAPQFGDDASTYARRVLVLDQDDQPARTFAQGDWMRVRASFVVGMPLDRALLGLALRNDRNILVHGKNGLNAADEAPRGVAAGEVLTLTYDLKLDVDFGEYTIDLGIADIQDELYRNRGWTSLVDLMAETKLLRHAAGVVSIAVIQRPVGSPASFTHYGVANLPSNVVAERAGPAIA